MDLLNLAFMWCLGGGLTYLIDGRPASMRERAMCILFGPVGVPLAIIVRMDRP